MDEIEFLRGLEGEQQSGQDLVMGAEHLVRLKKQVGMDRRSDDDLELEKEAKIFGSHVPDTIHHAAIPYSSRRQHYEGYLKDKSQEEPTGYPKAMLGGALLGAGGGALLGGFNGSMSHLPNMVRHGALIGGAVGGLAGVGTGALMAHSDKQNISDAKSVVGNKKKTTDALNDEISSHADIEGYDEELRHQQLLHEVRRGREKKAGVKDVAKNFGGGLKSGFGLQGMGIGVGARGLKSSGSRAHSAGLLTAMAAPAAAVGGAGYALGHHHHGKQKEAAGGTLYRHLNTKLAEMREKTASSLLDRAATTVMDHPIKSLAAAGAVNVGLRMAKRRSEEKTAGAILDKLRSNGALLAATGIGALAGGAGTYLASRPQKDTGKSKAEEELEGMVEGQKNQPARGLLSKMHKSNTELEHGYAKAFRDHPGKAAILGALTGGVAGNGIGRMAGALRGGK
jgi:hypothetical protein